MPDPTPRPTATDSALVVVDVQDKLLAAIPRAAELVRNVGFLLDTAAMLGVPALATEQYPKGLGPTAADLARRLTRPPVPKTTFSCCGSTEFLDELRALDRRTVVLVGMETHVCVAQTAFDLLDAGLPVFVPMDAVASRFAVDHDAALRRLDRAGAIVTTAEALAFEWVRDSAHPHFKAFGKLVIARTAGA